MVSGQHCPGEVVETPGARLAPIALPMRLGVIAPVADHRIAAAAGTAYTLAPALLAYQREALGIVQQGRSRMPWVISRPLMRLVCWPRSTKRLTRSMAAMMA